LPVKILPELRGVNGGDDGMKDALIKISFWVFVVVGVFGFLYPYYCLTNLKDMAEELEKIRKIIEDKQVTKS